MHLGVAPDQIEITKLFGQASARQYFRAAAPSREPSSYVVMKMPQGFASPAEEVTKLAPGAPREFSFFNVQKYLKAIGVRVPEVFTIDDARGLVLLEDLGDRTLENLVQNADGEFFVFYYKKVIDVLVDLQTKTQANPDKGCVAYYKKFNEELLDWELMHFLEYGLEDRFGVTVSNGFRREYAAAAAAISKRIAALSQGFTHRDFQSRNLMFKDYEFALIDFQDALVGPVLYDLVGLLRDSYITFAPEQRDKLLAYYVEILPEAHPYHGRGGDVRRDFHVVALQRKLKDTGRFQYIKTVKGNSGFLPHVPQSLIYVREAFDALPEYAGLRALISEYVSELR